MNESFLDAEYEAAWVTMIQRVGTVARYHRTKLGAFYPWLGSSFGRTRTLLVIGRATNGWESHEGRDYAEQSLCERLARDTQEEPLEAWVEGAWSRTNATPLRLSAFWRVTQSVARGALNDSSEGFGWARHVAWSNIAKLAPAATGNPGPGLAQFQWEAAVKLVQMEIEQLQPRLVLFMTGREGWFSWRSRSGACLEDDLGISLKRHGPDTWRGKFGRTTVVVAPHPRSKREAPIVDATLGAMAS